MYHYRSSYQIAPQYSDPPDPEAGMEEAPETCGVCEVPLDDDSAKLAWAAVECGEITLSDAYCCDACAPEEEPPWLDAALEYVTP
tara:strand:- start:210 stop:464 length:255 start_codon:yes stop_codon:yes gene_type:complete